MPGVVFEDDLAVLLGNLHARLSKVENYNAGALSLLTTTGVLAVGGNQTGVTTPTMYPGTQTASFTLPRQLYVLFIVQCAYTTSPGGAANTSNFGYVRGHISDGTTTPFGVHTNGNGYSDYNRVVPALLPAGTYTAWIDYYMDTNGGAGDTTMTVLYPELDVYLMGG